MKTYILIMIFSILSLASCSVEDEEEVIMQNGVLLKKPPIWRSDVSGSWQDENVFVCNDKVISFNVRFFIAQQILDGATLWNFNSFHGEWTFDINEKYLVLLKLDYINKITTIDLDTGKTLLEKNITSSSDYKNLTLFEDKLFYTAITYTKQSVEPTVRHYNIGFRNILTGEEEEILQINPLPNDSFFICPESDYVAKGIIDCIIRPYRADNGDLMVPFIYSVPVDCDYNTGEKMYLALFNQTQKRYEYTSLLTDKKDYGFYTPPFIYDGKVYASTSGDAGIICADLKTGEKLWENSEMQWLILACKGAEGVIVASNRSRGTWVIDAQTGKLKWEIIRSEMGDDDIAIMNGVIYFSARKLRALDLQTGKLLWDLQSAEESDAFTPGSVRVVPASDSGQKGKVISFTSKHTYCFEAER